MAVFTTVTEQQAQELLVNMPLGQLVSLQGIQGGIENTNYFLTSDQSEYVLTLFERLTQEQLPFYLYLMKHLALRDIPVPDPQANHQGEILLSVADKPAAIVNKLSGTNQLKPNAIHCKAVGAMLARMHLAGRDFDRHLPNLRSLPWWQETTPLVLPFITQPLQQVLQGELAYQTHIAASSAYAALPRGPIHGDLFRDNVMFEGDTLAGLFDFYFAGVDSFLYDLCVCLNDWCIDLETGIWDHERLHALIDAYQSVRPLQASERQLINAMLRGAAIRFWISRLWDFYLPRKASMLKAHDPIHFERIVLERVRHPILL